jgi:hypothetical protein
MMMQTALANEWKAQVVPWIPPNQNHNEIVWNLYALRGRESLHVVFIGNRQDHATYVYGDHRTTPGHRAAVIKILIGKPDPRKLVKLTGHELIEKIHNSRSVPWEHDSPAIEIMLAVLGKEVTWVRKIDGGIQQGTVVREMNLGNKYFRVYESPPQSGQRVLSWNDAEGGFRTVRINSIIDVV